MKTSPTSTALTTATPRMSVKPTCGSNTPRRTRVLTTNDAAVKPLRATATIMYRRKTLPCPSAGACEPVSVMRRHLRSDQVQQGEQEDPHDVNEVPVQARQLQHAVVLRAEPVAQPHPEDDGEDHQAAEDVQGVEAGHGEVAGRPQVAERDRR